MKIPTMVDRAMQALYLLARDPMAETTGNPHAYGLRTARSTADAMEQCCTVWSKRTSPQWILEGDIQSCCDEISHDWLQGHVPMDKAILRKWLKAGVIEQDILHPTEAGTPQGGIVSPVVAKLALDGLERDLRPHFPKPKSGHHAPVNLVREGDDFSITGRSPAGLEAAVQPLVKRFLAKRGLRWSPEKPRITPIEAGVDCLGQPGRTDHGQRLIQPAPKRVNALVQTGREVSKVPRALTAGPVMGPLHPLRRGGANSPRHGVRKATVAKREQASVQALWRGAKRRQPNTPPTWTRRPYFPSEANHHWVVQGTLTRQGNTRRYRVFRWASRPIQRPIKVKAPANPDDPAWEPYVAARVGGKRSDHLREKKAWLSLWHEQKGRCPIWDQPLTPVTGWPKPHLVWRTRGGSDHVGNRRLLHPHCHRQVHSQGWHGAKPRPAKGV